MSDQESVWYYTQHGERKGPVTLEVLRGALLHLKIDKDKDLIWGPGLQDWVKAEQVPQLQDMSSGPPPIENGEVHVPTVVNTDASTTIEKAPKPTAAMNPYKSPESSDDENALADAMAERRDSTHKGMGRLAYFLWNLFLSLGVIGGFLLIGGAAASFSDIQDDVASGLLIGILVASSVYLIISIWITLSRLSNLSMSRWNYLWSFVPFANIWLAFRVIACPAGYGQHKQLDTAGKVMRALFVLYIILCIGVPFLFSFASAYKQSVDEAARVIDEESQAKQEAVQ